MSVVRVTLSASALLVQTFCVFRVLILRRQASPTQTELRLEHSHMINEALEMITRVELHSKGTGTSDSFTPSNLTDAQA